MEYRLVKEAGFDYVEEGQGEPIILLHGLFGALSNWAPVLKYFQKKFTVIIPLIPIYTVSQVDPSIEGLTKFIADFIEFKKLKNVHLIGNSLGGHIALFYTLNYPHQTKSMVLTGSSGLFEAGMGQSFPRRSNKDFIRERVEYTFYSPQTATPELVNEVFDIVNDNSKALRIVKIARSAQRQNLAHRLHEIKCPTLLIWGLNDNITPVPVAHEFHRNIQNSQLAFIDRCGHAAMMEQPERFNLLTEKFLLSLQ
jgi:pimeloyl-ACP methyl ester carboxylesterase